MKNKPIFIIAAFILITLVLTFALSVPYFRRGGNFDTGYSGEDLENNYQKKAKEIHELANYFRSLLPEGTGASLKYAGRSDQFDLYFSKYNPKTQNLDRLSPNGKNISLFSRELENELNIVGWKKEEFFILVSMLKEANCIGISKQAYTGLPIQVIYGKGGDWAGPVFSYFLFETPLTDSLKDLWENKEGFRVYNDSVVFESGYPL